jgi:hypothetical protein
VEPREAPEARSLDVPRIGNVFREILPMAETDVGMVAMRPGSEP